jgi:predicted TIM-barrel fold metal-dependent hydrolase
LALERPVPSSCEIERKDRISSGKFSGTETVSSDLKRKDRMITAVDGHQHFWGPERVGLPWLRPEHGGIARPFVPEDLEPLLARAGVDRTILVQSACADGDNGLMFEHARGCGWIAAVVACSATC